MDPISLLILAGTVIGFAIGTIVILIDDDDAYIIDEKYIHCDEDDITEFNDDYKN